MSRRKWPDDFVGQEAHDHVDEGPICRLVRPSGAIVELDSDRSAFLVTMVPVSRRRFGRRLEEEVVEVSKATIVKIFWGSLIGLAGGLVLMLLAGALALANDVFIMNGPDVVGVRSSPLAWFLAGLCALAMLVILAAAVAIFVAWIGAVLNTANLPSKGWFAALLVIGLLGFVFIATLIYVIAGPDGAPAQIQTGPAPPQIPAPDRRTTPVG